MFDTTYYLHYVLDNKNDDHFTDDLLRLSPEAYLWHELKECHGFQHVVFVKTRDGKLEVEVFDSESEQLLHQTKKFFFSVQTNDVPEGIKYANYSLPALKQTDSSLLHWLLKTQKDSKKDKTALVCTCDALETMFRCSQEKGRDLLQSLARGKSASSIMVVRLETDAASIQTAFWSEDCCLADIDENIRAVLNSGAQQPLLEMLSKQLKGQLVDFSRQYSEIRNMLMYEALFDGDCQDSVAQMKDQADYLKLCCQTGRGLEDQIPAHIVHEPLKRNRLYSKLTNQNFRNILRAKTDALRQRNQDMPLEDLFYREHGISSDARMVCDLCCEDTLARKVAAITLPADYFAKHGKYADVPQQAHLAVTTLWNKCRNGNVCTMIDKCCDAILDASKDGDWDTVTDALMLIKMCARYICADSALEENLSDIFTAGEELLAFSAAYFRQSRDLAGIYPDSDLKSYQLPKDEIVVRLSEEATLEAKMYKLSTLRRNLGRAILYFDEHPLSEQVEKILSDSASDIADRLERDLADITLFGDNEQPDDLDQGNSGDNPYDL